MSGLEHGLEFVARCVDLVGIAIVLYGFALAAGGLVTTELGRFNGRFSEVRLQNVRIQLGGYILMGIEFMIASDIIQTVLSRELEDLIFVSALVIIRTAISFFLAREVKELSEQKS